MNYFVFKFKGRDIQNVSNKYLAEIYSKGPKYDVDLVAGDNQIVPCHKFVVSMFSEYLKDYLREFKTKGKICIPLPEFSKFVLQHVVDLFYKGHIMVGAEVKPRIENVLKYLKVSKVTIQTQAQHQAYEKAQQQARQRQAQQPIQKQAQFSSVPIANNLAQVRPEVSAMQQKMVTANGSGPNGAIQPAKRVRAQSMNTQPTNHTPYLHTSLEVATSKMGDQPIQFGGLSIKKAAPTTKPTIPMTLSKELSISRINTSAAKKPRPMEC